MAADVILNEKKFDHANLSLGRICIHMSNVTQKSPNMQNFQVLLIIARHDVMQIATETLVARGEPSPFSVLSTTWIHEDFGYVIQEIFMQINH